MLGEVLVDLELASELDVVEVLADEYGVPSVDSLAKIADPRTLEVLPRAFIEEHQVLPMFLIRNTLTVAVAELSNLYLIEEIGSTRLVYEVQIVAATRSAIETAIKSWLPAANVFVIDDIYEDIAEEDFSVIERQVTELADLEQVAGHGPCGQVGEFHHLLSSPGGRIGHPHRTG